MSTVLITGASGFLGRALAAHLAADHDVVCMSRKNPQVTGTAYVKADFTSFEDLRRLDNLTVDVAVHLAAVTGGCSERDGVMVNCEGTRGLMRYLIDRGCEKFVMASSIALVGFQSPAFRPVTIPIPDDHPCLDRDGYGFSKHLMEQVTHYYSRQNPQIDVINLRLSSVAPNDAAPGGLTDLGPWAAGTITVMHQSDAVRAFALAAGAPHTPGVRTMNATCSQAWTTAATAEVVRHWWGNDVDASYYDEPANRHASLYDVSAIEKELGFQAIDTLRTIDRSAASRGEA